MKLEKIDLNGKTIELRTSGTLPYIYRQLWHRDIFVDYDHLTSTAEKIRDESGKLISLKIDQAEYIETLERMTYAMAKHANPSLPAIEIWLEQFSAGEHYELFQPVMKLWEEETYTQSQPKNA